MGKLKALVIAYQDATKVRAGDVSEDDFWRFVRSQGGRLGLTDEQMDQLEEGGRDE
jgi:hypothetical protein